jgi:branched-chain amino acid transport system ATP-binding protein
VEFEGRDVTGLPQHHFAYMGVARSFQIANVIPQLSTRENIRIGQQALVSRYDMWRPRAGHTELMQQADELPALVGLWGARERTAKTLAHSAAASELLADNEIKERYCSV